MFNSKVYGLLTCMHEHRTFDLYRSVDKKIFNGFKIIILLLKHSDTTSASRL